MLPPSLPYLQPNFPSLPVPCPPKSFSPARADWQIQVDVIKMLVFDQETRLAEREADVARYEAIIAEIEAELASASVASARPEFSP